MAEAKSKPKKSARAGKPKAKKKTSAETLNFQAEMSRLLEIVAHSLYSDKEIFLRELISNASDACDRLRHAALTEPKLAAGDGDYRIAISVDAAARTVSVADNGLGMNRDDLIVNLGTIAKSGTVAFLDSLTGDDRKDTSLIGQFGVGFYSAFMVADRVEVVTRRAGEDGAWHWSSEGKGTFTIEPATRDGRGTTVTAHLRKGEDGFLGRDRLAGIVKRYSDHIPFPITLAEAGKDAAPEQVNMAAALWTRPKSDISADQYKEFYRHVAHATDEPWAILHFHAEGVIDYRALLFVPSVRPFDLFQPERDSRVKLYVSRVYITDENTGLVPPWLRFLRGVVDSEDLPLNVSREMLQDNPVTAKIRAGIVKRVLDELERRASGDADAYGAFWKNFGAVLKEGLYEGAAERDRLTRLCRFHSTAGDGLVSLDDYVGRMKDGQEEIFYIAGEDSDALAKSPQLEGYNAKGVEVLLTTDPVDGFWMPMVGAYDGKPFRSVTQGGDDLSKVAGKDKAKDKARDKADNETAPLVAALKLALGDKVKDVRVSGRLTESPVCLVAGEGDMDIHMERILRAHQQINTSATRILEINPQHALIKRLAKAARAGGKASNIDDAAHLLLDQARILEGEPVEDPAAFARRLSAAMAAGMG